MTPTNFVQMAEFIVGGGIAPTIGASNFAREKYVLEIYKLVATIGDFNENNNKCVLSNT